MIVPRVRKNPTTRIAGPNHTGGRGRTGGANRRLLEIQRSRREFLLLAGGVLGGTVLTACGSSGPPSPTTPPGPTTATYRSRPDLKPPLLDVTPGSGSPGSGLISLTPAGPLLVDDAGNPVWIHPVTHASANLRVQTWKGQQVLTWWQGEIATYGVGLSGEYVIVDSSYRQLLTVQAQKGFPADLHEFIISEAGIAFYTAYRTYTTDLSSVGGPTSGRALDATIQGVDLGSGALVFDWSSADHISFSESYQTYSSDAPFDPVHLNSVDFTSDGKLLISARNTWTVYKVDPNSGEIIWRLGGKRSDFALGPGARFAWQHDARTHADGTISLFDDEGDPPEAKQSRGLVLDVDETRRTATMKAQYFHPDGSLLAGSQGSVQVLPGGNVLIGWGAEPYYSELQADGTLVLNGEMLAGTSYRAFRFDWAGRPRDQPAVTATQSAGRSFVFVSWNGSTETVTWRLLSGASANSLQAVSEVPRQGFESSILVPAGASYAAVLALDAAGAALAQSPTIGV
jgi:Arylsulfotransferase (ASST)